MGESFFVHETSIVEKGANIGDGSKIWHHCHVRSTVEIGKNCILGKNVYVDKNVRIGNNVKIQNNVSVYDGVSIEDDVFVGPSVVFTNDVRPRAFIWDDSKLASTIVKKGASLGANSTIVCGDRIIGEYALVGAGAVVTKNVPPHALVMGCPAVVKGFVCTCAKELEFRKQAGKDAIMLCSACNKEIKIPEKDYSQISV